MIMIRRVGADIVVINVVITHGYHMAAWTNIFKEETDNMEALIAVIAIVTGYKIAEKIYDKFF